MNDIDPLMRYSFPIVLLSIVAFTSLSCHNSYRAQSAQYKDYRITSSQAPDPTMQAMLQPYRDSLNKSMNEIIGIGDRSLDKKSPEGPLGNFMVDAFLIMAREKFKTHVDVAFMNYGGIRLTQLPAGNVTRWKVYELMPFDNMLILQKVKGSVLQQVLDLAAAKGGWPVAGMTMQINNQKAVNVMIAGKPLDPEKVYVIANSDFIANGGDNADMLRSIPQENLGYLMRDAIIDYILLLKKQGKNINAELENRVTNAQ